MIPLKDNWTFPFSIGELFRNLNRMARWINGMVFVGGYVEHNEDGIMLSLKEGGGTGEATTFAWYVTGDALTVSITPGDIELGPDTILEWSTDITNTPVTRVAKTITSAALTTVLWIWVNVDIADGAESAELLSSTSSMTALTSEEKKHIRQKRIAKVTFTDDVVSSIERFQCGNIDIPRL